MNETRDQLIGIRFTKNERALIESLAKNRDLTLTDFIREAVFSHINHLKENVGNINIEFFLNKFDKMGDSIKVFKNCIEAMRKEFKIYDISKFKHELLKTGKQLKNLENL